MMSSDSEFDDELEGYPQKKFKMLIEDDSLPHSSSLCQIKSNQIMGSSQNDDDIIVTDNVIHLNSQNLSDILSSEGSDTDNDYTENKYDSESDDYTPISDGDFELEKYISDDETNYSEKINNEFIEDDFDENNETNFKPIIDDDLHDLLDKAYRGTNNDPCKQKRQIISKSDFKEFEKIVLEEVYKNHFDILPENWIEATHKSGMPIYLHKKTRVVSLSRPYFLGPGNSKSHLAPLSAISCLQYRKGLESKVVIKQEPDLEPSVPGDIVIPNAKVETAQENIIKESLTHDELRDYCKSLFEFKEVKSFSEIPEVLNIKKEYTTDYLNTTKERPSLPDSTKLISFPVQPEDPEKRCNRRREWILNPNGKSYVSILHEYLQQALKTQPWYDFKELDNIENPYSATVVLNDVQYGVGLGNSKKQAKLNAAKATLDILIPEMKHKINLDLRNQRDPVIFDQIKVTDPRVTEFCAKTTEPSPYAMLLVCLQRNFGECEIGIQYKLNNRRRMLNQCTMVVGKHSATVSCKNKRDGKQKASQIILGLLHPHIDNWGSLLRLYGNRSIKNAKEKKQEEQEITQLQSKAALNQPNFAILNKLKEEMIKVRDQRRLKEANDKLGIPQPMATSCPYTIAMPSVPDFG